MEFLVSASAMKQCDEYTIHSIGIPSMVLMERAAMAVVEEMNRAGLDLGSVLVVCGSGNNGGDGFAVARLLDEQGIPVTVAFVGKESSLTEETFRQKTICANYGIKPCSNYQQREYTVIVDALFGVGLSRKVEGYYAEILEWINRQSAVRVAVDIPSGISADNGRVLGKAVRADLTVTFAYRKIGHILYPGTEYCGKVIRRDIGITADGLRRGTTPFTYGEDDLARVAPRKAYSNKGTYGKVLIIAGSRCMSGAAYLSALSAYRSGSGLVRIFTPECNRVILQSILPEALISVWEDTAEIEEQLKSVAVWADVAVIGPGIGRSPQSEQMLRFMLEHWKKALVIDADGLNELSEEPDLLLHTDAKVIVTPHLGEMARLTGTSIPQLQEDLCGYAQRFAAEYHVVCVLKDARTIVTDGSRMYINTSGNCGMAVGGSGDVLSGLIGGFLGQKMGIFESAALGVYIHGLAGDLAGAEKGMYGMLAGDIADKIGEVLKQV